MEAIVFGAFVKERGVGFPDINTLEPLAEALDVSLLELMQSRVLPDEAVSNEDASAAVADALSFAGARKLGRILKWIEGISLGVMLAADFFLVLILSKYVTTPWIRGISLVALWLVIALSGGVFALRKAMDSPVPPTKGQILRWILTVLGDGLFVVGLFLKTSYDRSSGSWIQLLGLGLLVVRDFWKVTKKD